jgi:sortase (surface protein transpeptidase)
MAEVIIYHHLYNRKFGTVDVFPKPGKPTGNLFLKLSKFSALIGLALILFLFAPKAVTWGSDVINNTFENFRMTSVEVQTIKTDSAVSKPVFTPPFDAKLPKTNQLLIPSIGVNTNVQEATLDNYEVALKKGVWRVSDFGAPNDNAEPIILAAHRFGYLAWTDSYRRKNSFYNLPKVETGELIEIDWNQRKYLYEVYAVSKGKVILDYSADLILYTCQTLTGEEKVFVYAKLIVI